MVRDTWEDDDEDVKDAWDAEDEPTPPPAATASAPVTSTVKSKKSKGEATTTAAVDEAELNETPQERKARLERLVRERDLESAMSLFGITGSAKKESVATTTTTAAAAASASPFDTMDPSTVAEFDQFTRIITKRFEAFEVLIGKAKRWSLLITIHLW